MKLARFLFKPRWQSKDAATRRGAVAEASDAELVAALPVIARSDEDAGVRLTALRRLNHYEAWRERSTADADGAIRQTARAAYLAMLVGNSSTVPPLERRVAELDTLSPEEIERVAINAADAELRSAALERVSRASLLVDVAVADTDPKLRQIALARITDADALGRVAERTRKTDKLVSRLARERAETLRIAAGDAATIEARARLCCERIETLLARPRSERGSELLALDPLWAEVAERAPKTLRERFESTRAFLRSDTAEAAVVRERLRDLRQRGEALAADKDASGESLEALVGEANETITASPAELPEREKLETLVAQLARRIAALAVAPPPKVEEAPEHAPEPVAPPEPPSAEEVLAQAHLEAALARTLADKQKHEEQQKALRRNLDELVIELEGQLEAGDLTAAHETQGRIQTVLDGLPPIARHDKRLANAQARHAELKRWQRWSNNERRKQLCEALEALPIAGMHPDAVANRIREARQEWQQLDAIDGGESNPFGKRFHALCNQALKPAQGYFAKRDELRKTAQQEIEGLLQVWETPPAEGEAVDWNALGAHRREVSGTLRKLDDVEPRARKQLAQRLKNLVAALDARIDAHAGDIEAAKRKLIAEAERNATSDDPLAAARAVRDLQTRWKAIGNGRRRTDEAQWKEFRAQCDAVFGKLDTNRREKEQRDADAKQAAADVVAALEQLANGAVDRSARRELEQRWTELGVRERELDKRWQTAQESLDRHARDAERAKRQAVFHDALSRLAQIEAVEGGETDGAPERWQTTGAVPAPLGPALQQRFDAALGGTPQTLADEEAAREILVTVEFLAAIETPEADRKRRMDLQVARLSKRMSGGSATLAPREELLALLKRWVELGAAPADLRERFGRVYQAALNQLG